MKKTYYKGFKRYYLVPPKDYNYISRFLNRRVEHGRKYVICFYIIFLSLTKLSRTRKIN